MAGKRVVPDVTWEDPPQDSRGNGISHKAIAAILKTKPGTWARVADYRSSQSAGSTALMIRKGNVASYQPSGAFQAKARTVAGVHYVYARWIGEEGEYA